jgi:hypothetical protein
MARLLAAVLVWLYFKQFLFIYCAGLRSVASSANETTRRSKTSRRIIEQETLKQAPLSSDQMEEAMFKHSVVLAGTFVVLFAVLSLTGRAEAGASASAASKNTRAHQLAAHQAQTGHKAAKNDFGITEYSSSSATGRAR